MFRGVRDAALETMPLQGMEQYNAFVLIWDGVRDPVPTKNFVPIDFVDFLSSQAVVSPG